MCGIIGIINGNKSYKIGLSSVFNQLLFVDQLRGVDGAGVFWYDKKEDKYTVIKNEMFNEVFQDPALSKALVNLESKPFIIGHNRSATKGTVSTDNNHPFDEGNVVLVHNGTMTYIPKEFDKDTEVDSHAIAKMINQTSTEAFIKDSFGAYALVWFDKMSRELFLLRNKDRPLNILYYDNFALIASEAKMAEWIADRNNFQLKAIESIKEHHLYKFSPYNLEPEIKDLSSIRDSWTNTLYHTSRKKWEQETKYPVIVEAYEDVIPSYNEKPTSVAELSHEFCQAGIWDYLHKVNNVKNNVLTLNPSQNKSGTVIKFKKGENIMFSLDTWKQHGQFKHFVGSLPNLPMNEYEVRGNIVASEEHLKVNANLLEGKIATIVNRKGRTTIWLRDVKISDMPDPQFAAEIDEKKYLG